MSTNYTVIFSHPSGATATFIYEDGEMSALAKGLDAEQFWMFKQVKALLLRNEEDDLQLASAMMRQLGFTAQVLQPLPDLLASPQAIIPPRVGEEKDDGVYVEYRHLPSPREAFAPFRRPGNSPGEVHWREHATPTAKPPHKIGALALPEPSKHDGVPVKQWVPPQQLTPSHGEVHWREEH